ncbi:MAG TPA: hypothetical protein VF615_00955 [Longimicrobiaceae bacterium]|jgi:hypothetical protein
MPKNSVKLARKLVLTRETVRLLNKPLFTDPTVEVPIVGCGSEDKCCSFTCCC